MAVTSIAATDNSAAVSASGQAAAGNGGSKLFGGKGISFFDVLRVAAGGLMGGPIGAALSFASLVAERAFRKDDVAAEAAVANATATQPGSAAQNETETPEPQADASALRPGGWMVNMAYGARDPYHWSGPKVGAADPAMLRPGQGVADNATPINDPRLASVQSGMRERPGGWIVNAAYRDAHEAAQAVGLPGIRAQA
jgi:hypothetical protein